MDKYLLDILREINTIIIPDLGALTITDQASGEIMFMPYLKYDDGKLIKHIAEKEGWDENDAKNLVAKYVREIKQTLDQGDTYDMYQFGTFSKNEDGDVQFTSSIRLTEDNSPVTNQETEIKTAPSSETTEPTAPEASAAPASTTEVKKEAVATLVSSKADISSEVKKTQNDKLKAEKAAKIKADKEVAAAKLKAEKEAKAAKLKAEKEAKAKKAAEVRAAKLKAKSEKKPGDKKKKGVFFWISIILGPLLVLATVAVFLFREQVSHYLPFLKEHKEKTEISSNQNEENEMESSDEHEENSQNESNAQESDTSEEPSQVNAVETDTEVQVPATNKVVESTSTGVYMIIAGTFSEASNANKYLETVKGQGATDASIITKGERSTVILGRYNTAEEAKQKLSEYQSFAPKAWITK